jgi:hypothetical protein
MQNTYDTGDRSDFLPMESASASLDIPETSVRDSGYRDKFLPSSDYRIHLRERTNGEYENAEELYYMATGRESSKHCKRLNMCGSSAMFLCHKESGMIKVASSACHLRFCPICAKKRANEVTERITQWLEKTENPRLITLTIKHTKKPLREQLDNLIACWRKLYKSEQWKEYVTAGVWVIQITYNRKRCEWHPHLHILTVGKFFPVDILRKVWCRITGGSFVVDIRGLGQAKEAAKYVGRYVGRACNLGDIPKKHWVELYWSLNGKRLFGEFGTGRGEEKLLVRTKRSDLDEWEKIGFFEDIIKSLSFDRDSQLIYRAWKTGEPLQKILKVPKRIVDVNLNGDLTIWEFPEEGFFNAYTIAS